MSFDFSTLITDRSQSDLSYLKSLLSKPESQWAESEREQFNQAISKASYNYTDLNRVTEAMTYLDGVLQQKGYKSGFVPIKIKHDSVATEQDPNTLLLLHGESVEDSSGYSVPITNSGVQVSDAKSKFGGKSLYFDGVSSYLRAPCLIKGNSQFTIDFWLYPLSVKNNTLWSHGGTNVTAVTGGGLELYEDKTFIYYCSGFLIKTENTFDLNKWYHIALIGDGSSIILYIDGSESGRYSSGYNFSEYNETFGANDSAISSEVLNGYIDELRVSNIIRWESDFTPPTEPYVVEIPAEEPLDQYTWYESDVPTSSQMKQYIKNVVSVCNVFFTPELPEKLTYFTQDGANAIESALLELKNFIDRLNLTPVPCGVSTCGGDYL